MRILLVVNNGYEAGGAEKSVKLIRDTLIARGHEAMIVATNKNPMQKAIFADELIPAITGWAPRRFMGHFWNRDSYKRLRHIVADFKPDVVHFHTINEFSPSALWAPGTTPALMTVHGPEEFTRSMIGWLLPATDYKNESYLSGDRRFSGWLRFAYYGYIQRPIFLRGLKRLKLVIAPSDFMAHALALDIKQTPIKKIANGIVLPEAIAWSEQSAKNVLFVGRLETVKGVQYLLQAFQSVHQQLPSVRLRIVGDGNQAQSLTSIVSELGLRDSVDFVGWLNAEALTSEYAKAAVVVMPSIWPENFPTVGIEALAVGRALIGSRSGGISELIDDGSNGLLVEPRNAVELAQAMVKILSQPVVMKHMAEASLQKSKQFDHNYFMDQLINVYNSISCA